jgi:hypothetical protein
MERHDVEDLDDRPQRQRQSQRSQNRMPANGCNRRLGDQDGEANGQPAEAVLEHARQGTDKIVSVKHEPYAGNRNDQFRAVRQRSL